MFSFKLAFSSPLSLSSNCGKFFKRWEYQTTLPASCEICMQVKKQQLEPDMGQKSASKSGKEYVKAVYCHPAYLTSMQSTSCEMLGWMKYNLESSLLGEISTTSDIQMTPLMAESQEQLKSLFMKAMLASWKKSYDQPRQHFKKKRHYFA